MEIKCYDSDSNLIKFLTQWDLNQKIIIKDLVTSDNPVVHACNHRSVEAYVCESTYSNNTLTFEVPNILLQEELPLTIYIYINKTDGSAKTVYTVRIPINPRPKPNEYIFSNNAHYITIQELIKALSDAESAKVTKAYIDEVNQKVDENTKALTQLDNDFNSAFEKVLVGGGKNLLNKNDPDVATSKYLVSSGKLSSSDAWETSGYIPVSAGDNIIVSMKQIKNVGVEGWRENNTTNSRFCAYDSDKNLIADSYAYNTGLTYYTVPDNASYIRVSYNVSIYTEQMVYVGDTFDKNETYEPYAEGKEQLKLKDGIADIPTKLSRLENDEGYLTKDDIDTTQLDGIDNRVATLEEGFYSAFEKVPVAASKNLLNENDPDVVESKYLTATGNIGSGTNSAWKTSGYIPVSAGDNIIISQAQSGSNGYRANRTALSRFCAYDSEKTFIADSYAFNTGLTYYTVPENASYIRVSYDVSVMEKTMVFLGTTFDKTETYEPYTAGEEKLQLKDEVVNIPTKLSQLENDEGYVKTEDIESLVVSGYKSKSLALPETIYAFANQPIKIYFHNLADYNMNDLYVLVTTNGANLGELYTDRWEYTPTQAGNFTVTISFYDHYYNQLNKETFTFNVVDTSKKTSVTALVIGDSTVNASVETRQMLSLAENDGFSLTLLGTRNTEDDKDTNQHEGRGGWTAKMYCETASAASGRVINEFYNAEKEDTNKFDFNYYMANQGYSGVDCVFLQLGINDMFSANSDSQADASKSEYLSYIESMVRNIHLYDENIKIILNLIIPCSASQDNFAKAKNSIGVIRSSWRCRRNTYLANLDVLNILKEQLSDITNVYISPFNASLDVMNNMADHVHPTTEGYNELGTQMYSFMRAIN